MGAGNWRVGPSHASAERGPSWVRSRTPAGRQLVWHNGQTGGYSSHLVVVPEQGRAVVALASTADADALGDLARALL